MSPIATDDALQGAGAPNRTGRPRIDDGAGLRRREIGGSADHRVHGRDAVYVPIEDWDRWARSVVLGATWDRADETAILDRARALGWTP